MLKALTTIFSHHEPQLTPQQLHQREWRRCLVNATSQNERDEINDLFTGAFAA